MLSGIYNEEKKLDAEINVLVNKVVYVFHHLKQDFAMTTYRSDNFLSKLKSIKFTLMPNEGQQVLSEIGRQNLVIEIVEKKKRNEGFWKELLQKRYG